MDPRGGHMDPRGAHMDPRGAQGLPKTVHKARPGGDPCPQAAPKAIFIDSGALLGGIKP